MWLTVTWMVSLLFVVGRVFWWLLRRVWLRRQRRRQRVMMPPYPSPPEAQVLVNSRRTADELTDVVSWAIWAMSTDMHPDAVVRAIRRTDPNWWAITNRFVAHVDHLSVGAVEPELAGWCMHVGDIQRGREQLQRG